jgi:anti-anti-sigma factor
VLIERDETQTGAVLHLIGDFEHLDVGQFHQAVARVGQDKHVILDLSGVPSVDSAGLGALVRTVRRTRRTGGEAVVCAATPPVRKWLKIVAVPQTMDMFDSVAAARAHFDDAPRGGTAGRRAA